MRDMTAILDRVRAEFARRFGSADQVRYARAPGRVNIIGEHTDYNDGYVLQIAIDRSAVICFRGNGSGTVNLWAADFEQATRFELTDTKADRSAPWSNIIQGVGHQLRERGESVAGMDAVLHSDIPAGVGLGTGGAIAAAAAMAFCHVSEIELEKSDLARLCREMQRPFAPAERALTDPFPAFLGEPQKALVFDCRTLEHHALPFETNAAKVVVCDTQVKRERAESESSKRKEECEKALDLLSFYLDDRDVKALRDVSIYELKAYGERLPSNERRRARHVITENARVQAAVEALQRNNLLTLGVLMDASHVSLRKDYEVTGRELDRMVDIAATQKGVYGAKMTGEGFGGCAVSLVAVEHLDAFCEAVAKQYRMQTGLEAGLYRCEPDAGAEVLL